MAAQPQPEDVVAIAKPGPALWPELSTKGERAHRAAGLTIGPP